MPASPTKPGTLKLSDLARHVVVPADIVSTGWPSVEAKCLELGVRFDPWQQGLGRATLAKRADGRYAAGVGGVVWSIPRQIGKTYAVGAMVFALCILFPGLTVLWTAHRLKTAGETFLSMQAMTRRGKVAPFVEQVFTGSGSEEVRFRNGSRILFGARERGFGRGFAEVDIIVFDEAQILGEKALDDMVPAANQSKQPAGALLFFIGTPPKPDDPGEAFRAKRARAIEGKTTDQLYVEFSADPDADANDRKQWAKANPSYPHRTPLDAMMRMQANLSADSFMREALGIWDETSGKAKIPARAWSRIGPQPDIAPSEITGRLALAVSVPPDQDRAVIAAVGEWVVGGLRHAEFIERRNGTAWVVDRMLQLIDSHGPVAVVIDPGSPSGLLVPALEAAGIELVKMTARSYAQACGAFYASVMGITDDPDVTEPTLRHLGQPELDAAVAGAGTRPLGGEAALWAWDRRDPNVDISPLEAATLAHHGLVTSEDGDPAANVW